MDIMGRLWRSFCNFAVRVITQHSKHSLVIGGTLLALSAATTFIAANLANHLDSTPAPLDDLLAATFHCYPSFLHHPHPYLVLGIPPPPIFYTGLQRGDAGIGDYVYDDPKLLKTARRRLAKCWHSDKARLHGGLSMRNLEILSREDGIFEDALNRALKLANDCHGKYPAFIMPSRKLNVSKLSLVSMNLTFLDEAAKQDPTLAQQLSDPSSIYGFKPAKDCPTCTPDFLLQEFLEAAFTPPWRLPAQPSTWRHIPERCAPCTWESIDRSYRHFFGDWTFNWHTLTLNLTGLEEASRDGRLPPPGRTHELWWREDLDPPRLDNHGNTPSQRRIAFDLFCKYSQVAAKTLLRKVFGFYTNPAAEPVHRPLRWWGNISFRENEDYPLVIHLFTEQLAKYGRNIEVWRPTRDYFKCRRKECQVARHVWEQEHRK